jgi:hypothetical protein
MDMDEGSVIGGNIPMEPPITIMVSQTDQDWIDRLRVQSYHLAIERGHLRYN